MNHATRQRAFERMQRLGTAGLDLDAVFEESAQLLRTALPHDSSCWHTTDPGTLIETSVHTTDMPSPSPEVAELAYLTSDFNAFPALAGGPRHAGVLSEATGGQLERSVRYRELMRPNGVRGELRTAFVVDGACWGCVSLFRAAPRDFTDDERDFAHDLAALLGRNVRTAGVLARSRGTSGPLAPGVIMLDARRRVVSTTTPARECLVELGLTDLPEEMDASSLPFALLSLTERVREHGGDASARVLGRSGRWILLHAAPESTGGGVVVVLQAAPVGTIAPLISAAYGFTARERELVALVVQGCSTREIAHRLLITENTVQAHLKSVFAKAGVRSRGELTGLLHTV
ncbi:LuxR C-terminal-related transcriptional regulator [Actinomycetes bacterium KLBMP 9759]